MQAVFGSGAALDLSGGGRLEGCNSDWHPVP